MPKFEISGKEYDLKIKFKGIQELNKLYDSPIEFVGLLVAGSLEAFSNCVYAALTEHGIGKKLIEKEIEEKIERGELDLSDIMRIGYEVVDESFFYKKTVNKLLDKDQTMKEMYQELTKE